MEPCSPHSQVNVEAPANSHIGDVPLTVSQSGAPIERKRVLSVKGAN